MNLFDVWGVPPNVRDIYSRVVELYSAIEHRLSFEKPVRDRGKIVLLPGFPNCHDQAEIFASVFPQTLRARNVLIGPVSSREYHSMTMEEWRQKGNNVRSLEHAWCRIYGVGHFVIDPRPIGVLSGPVVQNLHHTWNFIDLEYSVLRSRAERMRLDMWKRIALHEAKRLRLV